MDHVYKNNIVTPEQAARKKCVWGTAEQLLINKSILEEVRLMRRKLVSLARLQNSFRFNTTQLAPSRTETRKASRPFTHGN